MIRVLAVTCDREYTDTLSSYFNSLDGFSARGACSEKDGFKAVDEDGPADLLIAEVCNPLVNGTRLILKLRRQLPSLPCIALAKHDEDETREFLENQGILRYLLQPVSIEDLKSAVDSVLEEARSLGFQGHMQRISLLEIIQLYCATGKTGRLDIYHWGRHGAIYFADGKILHSVQDELDGQEAFYRLVGWDSGTFRVELNVLPSIDTLSHESWHALLIEGTRRQDEAHASEYSAGGTPRAEPPTPSPGRRDLPRSVDPPDLEMQEAGSRSRRHQTVLKAFEVNDLLAIDGVEGLIVVNRNGVVLQAEDLDDPEETLGTLTTFLGTSSEATREAMGANRFTCALLVERNQRKLLVVNTLNFFIGIIGSAHVHGDQLRKDVLECVRSAASTRIPAEERNRGARGRRATVTVKKYVKKAAEVEAVQ